MPVSDETYTFIGAMIAIAASTFNAVGYTVQKKGHNRLKEYNKDKEDSDKKRLMQERVWIVGFSIYLIGGLLNAVSLFYAPQSLVLPLSAITLVVNTMLATKVLNEPFFKADIFGMLSVIIGSILAVIFGPRTAGGEATMNELKLRWGDSGFFLFFVILSSVMMADYLLVRYYEKKNHDDDTVIDELKHGSAFLLISYCLLAGYFGSLAFLFLKSFTEFIGSSAQSKEKADTNAANWYSYFTLICVVITNFILEFFRQRGLSYFHAVYVVPINQVVLIVMGTVMGGLYFEEFDNMSGLEGGMFVFAILLTVIGVFVLAFNSGNVVDSTEAEIDKTITISLEPNVPTLPGLPNVPSIIQTSPAMPITRSVNDVIPDMPPPGMAGTIARIHGLHRSMASMHFDKNGKPFYLHGDKLRVIHEHGRHGHGRTGHIKHSQSLPTYSHSSLVDSGHIEMNAVRDQSAADESKIEESENNGTNGVNGKNGTNGYHHKNGHAQNGKNGLHVNINGGITRPKSMSAVEDSRYRVHDLGSFTRDDLSPHFQDDSIEIVTKKYTDSMQEIMQHIPDSYKNNNTSSIM